MLTACNHNFLLNNFDAVSRARSWESTRRKNNLSIKNAIGVLPGKFQKKKMKEKKKLVKELCRRGFYGAEFYVANKFKLFSFALFWLKEEKKNSASSCRMSFS